ncbi:MAG: P-loop NTPase [Actinobacteria bacterium]|nr:P-loop NTPase [Actinomycetota bacterium]MBW3648006.1 P-loop NTPase [Actinomycetota bacterium]
MVDTGPMRVGLSGKGGVGKSTIAAVLSRTLARQGHSVVAVDCDSDDAWSCHSLLPQTVSSSTGISNAPVHRGCRRAKDLTTHAYLLAAPHP